MGMRSITGKIMEWWWALLYKLNGECYWYNKGVRALLYILKGECNWYNNGERALLYKLKREYYWYNKEVRAEKLMKTTFIVTTQRTNNDRKVNSKNNKLPNYNFCIMIMMMTTSMMTILLLLLLRMSMMMN